jgi:pimeloyl-ACP methyl ester carboxylesterase
MIEYMKWGEAPYMLLLPGTPGFAHFHFGLGEHTPFGVITVNRPGYGNVPITPDNFTASLQADLLVALMDHLGIEKFPLFVASGGGCIGLRMAIQYPEKVQCLIM